MKALLLSLALLVPAGVFAGDRAVSGADVDEIRTVIHRQIDAFRRDDAHGAFALVSPNLQQAFGTPERFLDGMRTAYRAVYRPISVSFLDLIVLGSDVVQPVQVTDRAGAVWVAYYAMQRQKDGSWRTHGCRLLPPARTISA
jgi:Domain of unknown function (DUF4864)